MENDHQNPAQEHAGPNQLIGEGVEQQGGLSASPPPFQLQASPEGEGGDGDAVPTFEDRPQFAESGFDEEWVSDLRHPWASEIERELSRMSRFARGYADRGNSELRDPFQDNLGAELDLEAQAFAERFLPNDSDENRARLTQLMRAYLEGYRTASPDNDQIADHVERQHGGYDEMAALLSGHSGNNADEEWELSESADMMQVLHDMGYWQDLDRRVVEVAEREFAAWTDTDDAEGRQRSESHAGEIDTNIERLSEYWRAGGYSDYETRGEQSSEDANGRPWSAAFISYVMMQAGSADTFAYSGGHHVYAMEAREIAQDGESTVTHPSRMLNADSEPVHVGGLIHRNRTSGTGGVTYDSLSENNLTHADLVVDIEIYDAEGNRVTGHYQDIIDGTPQDVLDTYQIFAVTIGGNTYDQELANTDGDLDPSNRTTSGSVAGQGNETTGRRYWELNTNLRVNNDPIPGLEVYGIQRLEHPERSDEPREHPPGATTVD